jgi:transposase
MKVGSKNGSESSSFRAVFHFISTLVATRYNPLIQAQYQQLLKRGKVKKVALTACMRKFLTILNAMMRDKVPFRQTVIA